LKRQLDTALADVVKTRALLEKERVAKESEINEKTKLENEAYICREMKTELEDRLRDLERNYTAAKCELVVADDTVNKMKRTLERDRTAHGIEVDRLQQEIITLKKDRSTASSTAEAGIDIEMTRLMSEVAEYRCQIDRKDQRIKKLEKSKLTEKHINTMRDLKVRMFLCGKFRRRC
jgi:SMC interacting uncharacterized protein involved in chromosome segregation